MLPHTLPRHVARRIHPCGQPVAWRRTLGGSLLALLIDAVSGGAQPAAQRVRLDSAQWDTSPGSVVFRPHRGVPAMEIVDGRRPVVLRNWSMASGTIAFDIEIRDPRFNSVYFRWQDSTENEIVYLRTERAGDPTARDAIQYAPTVGGINLWDVLDHYQGPARFARGQWNHVRLEIAGAQLRVFVNHATRPTLVVPRLEGNTTQGQLAFDGAAIIANLVVTPDPPGRVAPSASGDPTAGDPRYLRRWQATAAQVIPPGVDFQLSLLPTDSTQWSPITAERRGLINLSRRYAKSPDRRIVWLRTTLAAATPMVRQLALGFSDDVWVYLNGRLLYLDKNRYGSPIQKQPDGRLSLANSTLRLPLAQGENTLLIGVANDFFGWGIVARLDRIEGVQFAR